MFLSMSVFNERSRKTSRHMIETSAIVQVGPVTDQPGWDGQGGVKVFRVRFLAFSNGRTLSIEDSDDLTNLAGASFGA